MTDTILLVLILVSLVLKNNQRVIEELESIKRTINSLKVKPSKEINLIECPSCKGESPWYGDYEDREGLENGTVIVQDKEDKSKAHFYCNVCNGHGDILSDGSIIEPPLWKENK